MSFEPFPGCQYGLGISIVREIGPVIYCLIFAAGRIASGTRSRIRLYAGKRAKLMPWSLGTNPFKYLVITLDKWPPL